MYSEERNSLIAVVVLIFIGIFILVASMLRIFSPVDLQESSVAKSLVEKQATNDFANLNLEAKAVYVFDVNTNSPIFSINENAQLPLASLTKIMTALVAIDMIPDFTLVPIRKSDINLAKGEKWNLKDLIEYTLLVSSNDGANAIANVVGVLDPLSSSKTAESNFVDRMNEKAGKIGLGQTYFLNESGLDVNAKVSGAYGSARDVANLFTYALKHHPEIIEATKYEKLSLSSKEKDHNAVNTNKSINNIPNIIGSKTGYTDLAGGNLVISFDAGIEKPIVVVVLGSTEEGRFTDAEKLAQAVLKDMNK